MRSRNARKSSPRCFCRVRKSRLPVLKFITPKTTRQAFQPLRSTLADCPRGDHAARSGGNSSRSVSSSANTTLRRGSARISRQIRLFFLALGIRSQDVTGTFPFVPQAAKTTADGLIREGLPHGVLQLLLEQRDRPVRGEVSEVLRRAASRTSSPRRVEKREPPQ